MGLEEQSRHHHQQQPIQKHWHKTTVEGFGDFREDMAVTYERMQNVWQEQMSPVVDKLFRQITMFIQVRVAFGFGPQTL